ncbi:MAG: hypothetical protein FJ293_15405 [Planctomycetes bacterium]|nr:hypothetical protein [Planctomycetota bacterium]
MEQRRARPELVLFATLALAAAGGVAWLLGQWRFAWSAERSFGHAQALVLDARCNELVVPRPYGRVAARLLPEVWYAYEVDGVEHEGRAIAPLWLPFLGSDHYQRSALATVAPLGTTTIRFNPAAPQQAFLTLSFDAWLVGALVAALLGVALQASSAWLAALHGRGRGSPPLGHFLIGGGTLAFAARYASWGEWLVEPWLVGAAFLVVAVWRVVRRPAPPEFAQAPPTVAAA